MFFPLQTLDLTSQLTTSVLETFSSTGRYKKYSWWSCGNLHVLFFKSSFHSCRKSWKTILVLEIVDVLPHSEGSNLHSNFKPTFSRGQMSYICQKTLSVFFTGACPTQKRIYFSPSRPLHLVSMGYQQLGRSCTFTWLCAMRSALSYFLLSIPGKTTNVLCQKLPSPY